MTPEDKPIIHYGPINADALKPQKLVFSDILSFNLTTGEVEILGGLKPDEAGRKAVEQMSKTFVDLFEQAKSAARLEALEEAAKTIENAEYEPQSVYSAIRQAAAAIRERAKANE